MGLTQLTYGQNLILNGNFETFSACPIRVGEINKTINWVSLNSGTPDFYHKNCAYFNSDGTIDNGSLGLIICCDYEDAIEYFGQELSKPLAPGNYKLSFKIKIKPGPFYTNNFGVILRKGNVKLNHWGPYIETPIFNIDTPLIASENWRTFETALTAKGGEDFIAFGNFISPEKAIKVIDKTQKIETGWQTYVYVDEIELLDFNNQTKQIEPQSSLTIFFDFDSFSLKRESQEALNRWLNEGESANKKLLKLEGFTDSDGSIDYNLQLSKNRIRTVKTYIASQINEPTFLENAFGEENPKFSNGNLFEKPKNRSVIISIMN